MSGGEPFESIELCNLLINGCKDVRPDLTIWCYTGYTFEEVIKTPEMCAMLNNIDILVDGLFVQELRDITLAFRGSSNQRIIDVKKSLESDAVVLYDKVKQ